MRKVHKVCMYYVCILFTRYLEYPRFFSRERLVSGTRRIYVRSRTCERKKYATVGIFLDKSNELQYYIKYILTPDSIKTCKHQKRDGRVKYFSFSFPLPSNNYIITLQTLSKFNKVNYQPDQNKRL